MDAIQFELQDLDYNGGMVRRFADAELKDDCGGQPVILAVFGGQGEKGEAVEVFVWLAKDGLEFEFFDQRNEGRLATTPPNLTVKIPERVDKPMTADWRKEE